jgi:subtilisin family serine protease
MTAAGALAMPWAPGRRLYCAPGRVVLKTVLGEAPERIPTARDVKLGALAAPRTLDGGPMDRVIAHFTRSVQVIRVHGAAASRGRWALRHTGFNDMEMALGLARTFRIDVDDGAAVGDLVDALRQLGAVEAAVPYYLCAQTERAPASRIARAMEDAAADPGRGWGSRDRVGVRQALEMEPGDPSVIIGVVDTGVAAGHPELRRNLRPGYDTVQLGLRDLARGVQLLGDLAGEDREPEDEVGHGTACAAIIGASGGRLPPGIAGGCSVLPMRVLGSARVPGKDEPVGIGSLTDIDDGMKRCVDLGATVLNLSFGTPVEALDPHDPVPHADVVRYALARGCILVAASGNSGREEKIVPAALPGVIAVGAIGEDGTPAHFSTTGDHVRLCAPGERVVSAGIGGYQAVTGTSFASPFVAGAAALMVSLGRRRSSPVDPETVGRVLGESARPWSGRAPPGNGVGTLDAAAALRRLAAEIDGPSAGERARETTLAEV